jgi:hypothetical protein
MATTTNYSWTTPDDTALVKDGAAAIRSLGTAIDTTVFNNASAGIAKSIVDAKGDIIAATAADTVARLAVGANDQVLTADSSTATGLKWATPAGGALTYTLLNSGGTSLSGSSTVTVSSLSGYDVIKVLILGASVGGSGGAAVITRINADNTSKYHSVGNVAQWATTYDISNWGFINQGIDTQSAIQQCWFNFSASAVMSSVLTIEAANSTSGVKPFYQNVGVTTTSGVERLLIDGFYSGTSVVSSISVIADLNFDAGTVYVYGGK